ncbi:MAG: 50S ribosomal protein L3 [Patescibacteria group bacterium]
MKFILAKKVNMTQVFGEDGKVQAATILSAGPVVVTQVKNKEKDGYEAVQVGFGVRKEKNISKAVRGHTKDLALAEKTGFEYLREYRSEIAPEIKRGDSIGLDTFSVGDKVQVSSVSKGRGFQGVVKRHGFHGGPRTHGQKHSEREAGSIGGGGRAGGRVVKGMRMAGRMGGDRVTVKNLKVVAIDPMTNTLLVSGAVPGRKGTLVEIRSN